MPQERNRIANASQASKRPALRTPCFKERAARADIGRVLALLDRAGDEPPREGDEIPA